MAGYIGSRAVSVNTTSATITDDLTIGDDLTVTDDMTVGGTLGVTGVITGLTVEATGDTAAGDNAAMGYTAAEGLILTGQGSTGDVTIKNDADAVVLQVPTGTTNVNVIGALDVDGVTNLDVVDIDGQLTQQYAGGGDFIAIFQNTTASSPYGVMIKDAASGATGYPLFQVVDDDGSETHFKVQSGTGNVEIGAGSDLITKTSGTSNVKLGVNAGDAITANTNYNVLIGDEAGTALNGGDSNVAIGFEALASEDAHGRNTAIGYEALKNLNAGIDGYTVAVGDRAGTGLTTGLYNTLIGAVAGASLTEGGRNVAIGLQALDGDSHGSGSIAIGVNALTAQDFDSATNAYNVAIGDSAGTVLTTGIQNTMLGGLAGAYATTTDGSTFVGHKAAQGINGTKLTGNLNTVVGYEAGLIMQGACTENTILGAYAADNLTTGNANTFLGTYVATDGTVTGDNNTCVGHAAGAALTSGDNHLFLGHDAGRSGSPGGNYTSENNNIVLGNGSIAEAHIQVDWTVASDQRDKTDFTALDLGLDFVKALAPVTYKWDKRFNYGDKTADDYDLNAQTPDGTHKEDWLDVGFKAQEVQALEEAAGYTTAAKKNLTISTSGDGKQMGIQYSKFIPILVKAIQEQNALIEALTARVATLEG